MRLFAILAALAAAFILTINPSAAQTDDIWRAGARVNVVASGHKDVWAAGALVSVRGTAEQDIRAAGAEVTVSATAKRDAWVAGAIVSVTGATEKDLMVMGARVNIDARVGGNLNVAGARVLIGPQTEVTGMTQLAGADVVFGGVSRGRAEFYGDAVEIDGRVLGDLLVRARTVTVGRTAVIEGNVVFETFGEPTIEEGATVRGRQTVTLPRPRRPDAWTVISGLAVAVLFAIGAGLVLGLVLLVFARAFVERTIRQTRGALGGSILAGIVVLILLPLLALAVMMTVVGIPIGILMLLAMPLLLLTAAIIAVFGLSDWALNRAGAPRSFGMRLLILLGGLVVLALVGVVPVIGFLVWLAAILLGLGAMWRTLRGRPERVNI
jgi:hypothetical protein